VEKLPAHDLSGFHYAWPLERVDDRLGVDFRQRRASQRHPLLLSFTCPWTGLTARSPLELVDGKQVKGVARRRREQVLGRKRANTPRGRQQRAGESVTERFASPGIRFVALEGSDAAFHTAVLTHPDTESLATLAFLRAVMRTVKQDAERNARTRIAVAA
jgi:hypothetical protein